MQEKETKKPKLDNWGCEHAKQHEEHLLGVNGY
jgi:hypothetical protein